MFVYSASRSLGKKGEYLNYDSLIPADKNSKYRNKRIGSKYLAMIGEQELTKNFDSPFTLDELSRELKAYISHNEYKINHSIFSDKDLAAQYNFAKIYLHVLTSMRTLKILSFNNDSEQFEN